jgi:hypothetical protein
MSLGFGLFNQEEDYVIVHDTASSTIVRDGDTCDIYARGLETHDICTYP